MPRRTRSREHAPPLQALLFWQVCLICGILGLLAPRWPEAAALGLILVFWADSRLHPLPLAGYGLKRGAVVLFCCLLAAYVQMQLMPPVASLPAWAVRADTTEEHPRLRGTVEKVQGLTDQRLRITLSAVSLGSLPQGEILPGKLLWTWDKAPLRPVEGQTWAFSLPLSPITGFKNQGLADWAYVARSQDQQWRMWSKEVRGSPAALPQTSLSSAAMKREALRQSFVQNIHAGNKAKNSPTLTQAQAIVPALLFGDRSALHSHTIELFTKGTLVHSLALSGQHLAVSLLLAAGLVACAGRVHAALFLHQPRIKVIMLCALPLALLYLWLGAAPASLQRAACMMAVLTLCLWRNTSMTTLDILCAAVLCLLLVNPLSVFDLGLQLSVVCVASIGLVMPLIRSLPHIGPKLTHVGEQGPRLVLLQKCGTFARSLCSICVISCAIQIALLPLSLLLFHTTSPWFFLNVLWLPVLGAVVLPLSALALGLTALHLPTAAHLCTVLAVWPCQWLLHLLEWLNAHGLLDEILFLRPHWTALFGYSALLLAAALLWKRPRLSPASKRLALAGALLLLVGPVLRYGAEASPKVSLRMLDVGQGQALALELPHGKKFVIDGGGSPSPRFKVGQGLVSPTLTYNSPPRVTALINSHPHIDHLDGLLYLKKHFQVQDWQDNRTLAAGDQMLLSQNPRLLLEVLHPPRDTRYAEENNNSLVLRLVQVNSEGQSHGLALIPGDVEHKALRDLLSRGVDLQADVLVLPHHGSKTSFSPALYDAVRPQIALVSYGAYNRYGCPAPIVVQALHERRIRLFKSAEDGQVRLVWHMSEGRFRLKKPVDTAKDE